MNEHLDFPHAGQVFLVERETIYKRTGKVTDEVVLGVTSRIRMGHGPENIARLCRFACGVIQFISKGKSSISQKMQQLNRNTRLVFGYLRMTSNSTRTRSH